MTLSQIYTGTPFDVAISTDNADILSFSQLPSDQISSLANSAGNDLIFLQSGNDWVLDNDESRSYFGGAWNDTMSGASGDDLLAGNSENDVLSGNQGNDTLSGGQNEDALYGGRGDDLLFGDLGDDLLFGDLDNDVLTGGAGNDTLTGGQGNDIFILSNSDGLDRITDFQDGTEFIQLPESLTFSNLAITTNSSGQALITNTLTNQQLAVLDGVAAANLTTADFISGSADGTPDPFGERTFNEYEAFISPGQEPGGVFDSDARGYGEIRFAKNLSFAEIDVQIAGLDASEITAFHIHCGPPGVLGPIVVNFGQYGDFTNTFVDGKLSVRVTNENLTFINPEDHTHTPALPTTPPSPGSTIDGLPDDGIPKLPEGCPVDTNLPGQVNTVAGFESLARRGVMYFNVHTAENSFYGEMRGQIYPADE
jgi:CHRD domain/RTX calcium-binding nonapeptide repeat (4 copies)